MRHLLGFEVTLEKTPEGNIFWPSNTVASLSHKKGHIAFSFAHNCNFKSIGIDLESILHINPKIEPMICSKEETLLVNQCLNENLNLTRKQLLATIFSYKEALFKCHFPVGHKKFYFHDVQIDFIDFSTGKISAKLLLDTTLLTRSGDIINGHFEYVTLNEMPFIISSCFLKTINLSGS